MNQQGLLIILSGPSGSGKDTVLSELLQNDKNIQLSVSMTTRKPREGEIDGIHYFFTDEKSFLEKLENDQILEYAKYGDNYYGTPKAPIDAWLNEGKNVILKIEVQGAEKIRRLYPDVKSIFLIPPSVEILESRMRGRKSEAESEIIKRMKIAIEEINRASEYDYIVVNDALDVAVSDVAAIIKAEQLKYSNMKNKISEVLENV